LALIKGKNFPSSGDEPEENIEQKNREEALRKGGLIKASKLNPDQNAETSLLSPIPGGQEHHKRRGRVLKPWETSTLRMPEEGVESGQDDENSQHTGSSDRSRFVDGQPMEVVMVPPRKKPPEPEPESVPDENAEFTIEEDPENSEDGQEEPEKIDVDVEAIIAAAEEEGQEKANMIVEQAQAEAKKLIEQAKVYGETAKSEAHQEGFKLGKEDGYKAGQEAFAGYMKKAGDLIKQIMLEHKRVFDEVEPVLAKLAVEIAKKVISDEVNTNPDVVISVVKQALVKMRSREKVIIKVNPDDLEHARNNREIFAAMIEGIKEMDIVGDPRVDKGGCLIETNLGNTDARIGTQIEAIEIAFMNMEKEECN
jgi:flagellar assembly protein FliH